VHQNVVNLYDSLITETQRIISLPDKPKKLGQIKNLLVSYIEVREFAWDGARELDPSKSSYQYYLLENFVPDNSLYKMLTDKDKEIILKIFYDYPFYKRDGFYQMFHLVAGWESNEIIKTLLKTLSSTLNTNDFHHNHDYMLYIAKKTANQKADVIARNYYKSHGDLRILVDFLNLYEN
jgi:hypothetical protein